MSVNTTLSVTLEAATTTVRDTVTLHLRVPPREGHTPLINTVGLVLVALALLVALAVAKAAVCCRAHSHSARRTCRLADEELCVSSQILDLERLSALGTPLLLQGDTVAATKPGNSDLSDVAYTITAGTADVQADKDWPSCAAETDNTWSCRTWLLESVDRLAVIREESEDCSSPDTFTDSPNITNNDGDGDHRGYNMDDSGSVFFSCKEGGPADMVFSGTSTTTGVYWTCSQPRGASTVGQSGPAVTYRSEEGGGEQDLDEQDHSHRSNTSDEVSSGCFDLS